MKYSIAVSRKFRYVRTYRILKRVNDRSNAISRVLQGLINRYLLKGGERGA